MSTGILSLRAEGEAIQCLPLDRHAPDGARDDVRVLMSTGILSLRAEGEAIQFLPLDRHAPDGVRDEMEWHLWPNAGPQRRTALYPGVELH